MPYKEFLEEYPLFKKRKADFPRTLKGIPKPAINMICNDCDSLQTFNMTNEFHELNRFIRSDTSDRIIRCEYTCQSCRKYKREFFIYISPKYDYIYKIGQYPKWEIKLNRSFEKKLGIHSGLYKKGLICESQGYGIGAFSYYRRITENIIDNLLDSIGDLLKDDDKGKYIEALELTKKTRVTQEKIDLVKDLIPMSLRPNGMNPLGILHSELSQGLHSETDENCLETAGQIRTILVFLVNQIIQQKANAKEFTDSMKHLLDKKSKK